MTKPRCRFLPKLEIGSFGDWEISNGAAFLWLRVSSAERVLNLSSCRVVRPTDLLSGRLARVGVDAAQDRVS
jgi:hypothetical protein